jgi:hypothetical protein
MSDIANKLRERSLRAEQEGEPLALLDEAAEEIERLRLTDAEREAIAWFANYGYSSDGVPGRNADTLRGLLERLRNGAVDGCDPGQ